MNFRGANLTKTVLRGANLAHANLGLDALGGRTRLQGADLSCALVGGASFEGATYDETTIFPDGFDAQARKMVKVG